MRLLILLFLGLVMSLFVATGAWAQCDADLDGYDGGGCGGGGGVEIQIAAGHARLLLAPEVQVGWARSFLLQAGVGVRLAVP